MKYLIGFLMLLTSLMGTAALNDMPSGEYGLDKTHGYINFSYSHFGFSNPHVGFTSFSVSVNLDAANPAESSLEVEIDVKSIDSRVEIFNEHLLGEKYFNEKQFPKITFESTHIEFVDEDTAKITGELTIKGIAKTITLDATLNKAAVHPLKKVPTLGVSALAHVNRSDWDLKVAVPFVSDAVEILIEVELPQVTSDK